MAGEGASIRAGQSTVIVANLVNAADRDNLAAMADAARAYGLPAESMAPEDVPGLRPARGHEAVGALFLPAEGWIDAEGLLAALDTSVRT